MFDYFLFQANLSQAASSPDATDWIRAIAAALGIPVAIWGIIEIFRKDKAQERKLNGLEELARNQVEANGHFRGQVHELRMTTKTLEEHSHYFAGNLKRLTEQSTEMFRQTQLARAANNIMEQRLLLEIDAQKEYLEVQYEVTKDFFLSTILNLEKGLNKQAQTGREFAETIALQRLTDFTLNFSLSADEMMAVNFSLERLFRIFVVQSNIEGEDKAQIFAKLVRAVEYLKVFKTMCQQELTVFSESIARYNSDWRLAFGRVHGNYEIMLREVARQTGNEISKDPLMKDMADVVIPWMQSVPVNQEMSKNDPFYVVPVLVEPLKEVCRKHVLDPRIEAFLPDIVKCELALREMKNLKSSTSAFYRRISNDLEGIVNDLMDVYGYHASNP